MMTTTFVSGIIYFSNCFSCWVCYGFYSGVNREPKSMLSHCSPTTCIWAALGSGFDMYKVA